MQENEFEKKLQQKLDTLQVQPAEAVWQKIQAQVAKRNDRKRRVAILFFTTLLLLAGWMLTDTLTFFPSKKTPVATTKNNHLNEAEKAGPGAIGEIKQDKETVSSETDQLKETTANNIAAKETEQQANPNSINSDKKITSKQQDQSSTATASIAAKENKVPNNSIDDNSINKTHRLKHKTKAHVKARTTGALPEEETGNNVQDITLKNEQKGTITTVAPSVTANKETTQLNTETIVQTSPKQKTVAASDVTKKESTAPGNSAIDKANKPGTKKKQPLLGLAFTLSVGRSATSNSYMNSSLSAYYDNNTGSLPGTGSNNTYLPSSTRPGLALAAGVTLYRNISARSRIVTGLQYRLQTTSIKTGEPVALSSATASFRNGNTRAYTNYYHFITVPLSFSTAMFNIGQKEVDIDGGINISRVIHSNSLGFNTNQGVYYSDQSVFNKTIFGLSAAACINLNPKGKTAFYIGPEFYYSLTPLASSGIYSKSHYSFLGIRLQKNLSK